MKAIEHERWDWKPVRGGNSARPVADLVILGFPNEKIATIDADLAHISLIVDAPALLSALIGLYQAHIGFEAATNPDPRIEEARDLIHKYRRINQRLTEGAAN